jgi:hypothetical protein
MLDMVSDRAGDQVWGPLKAHLFAADRVFAKLVSSVKFIRNDLGDA